MTVMSAFPYAVGRPSSDARRVPVPEGTGHRATGMVREVSR